MNESSYLDPSMLQAQCDGAIRILDQDIDALHRLDNSLDTFINDEEIAGAAFDALKQQIGDYKTITQAICAAHETDKGEYQSLKGAVAGEVLDGSIIIPNKKRAKEAEEECRRQAAVFNMLAAGCPRTTSGMRDYCIGMANSYAKLAEINREIYEKWKRKEEKYDDIEGATGGMFEASAGIREAIREGLSDIAGAFQSGSYRPNMEAIWRRDIKTAQMVPVMKKELEQIGIEMDAERVRELLEMGYTVEEIKVYQLMCRTPEDKEFLIQILLGTEASYIRAFETNPNELSEGMTIFMSDYAVRLLELDKNGNATKESAEKIMLFNNALLASERYCTDQEGNLLEIKYRDVYLMKLHIGTEAALNEAVKMVASMNPNEEGYQELYHEYQEKYAMAITWASEYIIVQKLKNTYNVEDTQCRVSDFQILRNRPEFSLNHYSPWNGCTVSENISIDFFENANVKESYEISEEYKRLKKEREHALSNYMALLMEGVGMAALEKAIPGAAMLVSLTEMGLEGKAGTISGLGSITSDENGELGIKILNTVAKDSINSGLGYINAGLEIEKLDYESYLSWFGSGGYYEILEGDGVLEKGRGLVMEGVYNPEILRQKLSWEKQGIDAWLDYDLLTDSGIENKEDIREKIKDSQDLQDSRDSKDSRDEEAVTAAETLLDGKTGMFETMSMEDVNNALKLIQEATSSGTGQGSAVDLKTQFFLSTVAGEETE